MRVLDRPSQMTPPGFMGALLFGLLTACQVEVDDPRSATATPTSTGSSTNPSGPSNDASGASEAGASVSTGAMDGGAEGSTTSGADASSGPGSTPPPGSMVTTFASSNDEFPAADRGFYVTPNDGEMNVATLTSFAQEWGNRLFLYTIDLSPYRGGALPSSFLADIDARFAALRGAGAKAVLMARYSDSSSCEDAPLAIVKQHLAQLKPVYAANVDVIAYVRAGIIGAWGEGWCSTNGLHDEPGHSAVRDALFDAVPANLHVAFQPIDMQEWQSFPRAASKNDCFMASDDDEYNFPGGLGTPLRSFAMARNDTVPYGGETCDNGSSGGGQARTSCADILSEGRAYHVAHLNQGYAPVFINRWKADGCFDEVRRSIGYRLALVTITHAKTSTGGAAFAVDVRNDGWARTFSHRPLVVSLQNKTTGAVVSGSSGDLNQVGSGKTVTFNVAVTAPPGDYTVHVSAPDIYPTTATDPRFSVRFANANQGAQAWNDATGRFATGTSITVQ